MLSDSEKVKVINNASEVSTLNFRELLRLGIVAHGATILFNENSVTYEEIINQVPYGKGRKALTDLAMRVLENSNTHLEAFVVRYANDSSLTTINGNLISKIPDIVPAIFPDIAGLIQFDRPQ